MFGHVTDSLSCRIFSPQTRKIAESRNVSFSETWLEELLPAGHSKLLESNEETLHKETNCHWDILGHLQVPKRASPNED